MRVLVIGSGGREHALAWALGREAQVYSSPGNAATGPNVELNIDDVAPYARLKGIDLVVVGPEAPLADGLADRLTAAGVSVFGPSREAARLEASKAFSKDFMNRYDIPTAKAVTVTSVAEAEAELGRWAGPVVVKASGLAAGKGVSLHQTAAEALLAVRELMEEKTLGDAADEVLLEEMLFGQEASFLTLVSGDRWQPLPLTCDYKRRNETDAGPNTGGMGAYSPVAARSELLDALNDKVMTPVLKGLHAEGLDYRGVLYVGLMVTADGPRVLEFNVRFGDPETQVIVPLLDGSWLELLQAVAEGRLAEVTPRWTAGAAVGVVVATPSYPTQGTIGIPLPNLEPQDLLVFHGATRRDDGVLASNGGRVLTAVARRSNRSEARRAVYDWLAATDFSQFYYRPDIAAIDRL